VRQRRQLHPDLSNFGELVAQPHGVLHVVAISRRPLLDLNRPRA